MRPAKSCAPSVDNGVSATGAIFCAFYGSCRLAACRVKGNITEYCRILSLSPAQWATCIFSPFVRMKLSNTVLSQLSKNGSVSITIPGCSASILCRPSAAGIAQRVSSRKSVTTYPTAMDKMQAECVQWWAGKKQRLREQIANFVATAHGDEAGPYYSWRYSVPGWQSVELLRHHSGPAIGRRITSSFVRLFTKGRLRA